jgi:nicotinamide riboside kinase
MKIHKVVVTGPESTGKTTIASRLASFFGTVWIPEYARDYVLGLGREYTYNDIEHIAREQLRLETRYVSRAKHFLFYDTWLIITKVWFRVKYDRYPAWIDDAIRESGTGLYLVCDTDIPWVADNVRENGGEMRDILLAMYREEIGAFGIACEMVSGDGDARLISALNHLDKHFDLETIGFKLADR